MKKSDRLKLHFGPYKTPRFRYGGKVQCQVRGELRICGISDAPIPWPIGQRGSIKTLVIYGALARAISRESVSAVAHWWGISAQTVTTWRRKLGISGQQPEGTSRLRSRYFKEPWAREVQKKAHAKARDPLRRAKIAAAKRGKPRPRHVIEAMRQASLGRHPSEESRRKMSEAHRKRGTRPPWLKPPWEEWEDELVRTVPPAEVVRRTERSLSAVRCRRRTLGLPDGRTRVERNRLGR